MKEEQERERERATIILLSAECSRQSANRQTDEQRPAEGAGERQRSRKGRSLANDYKQAALLTVCDLHSESGSFSADL